MPCTSMMSSDGFGSCRAVLALPSPSFWTGVPGWPWKDFTGMPLPEMCASAAGLSLVAVRSAGALLAFGGYNGKYHNSAQVFRPGEGSPYHSLLLPA